jgi:LuxR family maltose regulon positive regulatory protein
MYGLFTAHVQKTRLLQAKGEIEAALKELHLLEQTFQRREFTYWAQKVSLLLAAGDLAAAASLVPSLREILGASHYAQQLPLIAAEAFKLSLARITLAQGEIEKASQLLDEIQATVIPDGRYGRLLEVYLLRALALHRLESEVVSPAALENMESALALAVESGMMMLFLEEGQAVIPLLQAVLKDDRADERVKKYAQSLLYAYADAGQPSAAQPAAASDQLVEQLTPREMEVLLLIAAGDSNQEIAEKLVVTVRTVKKHNSNIYGKLNVSNRTQAAARARALGLLPED